MAAEILITANSAQEYWVAIRVNGMLLRAQIDTGMTQPSCEIGLGLGLTEFNRIGSDSSPLGRVEYATITSPQVAAPVQAGRVSIEGLDDSEVETGIALLDSNLLGVCFFHRLPGFELVWDFASRTMILRRIQGVRT